MKNIKTSFYICSVEVATVNLQSQLRFNNPSGDCWRRMIRTGFFLSEGFTVAEEPGIGQTWGLRSLDQINSVLGNRKPRRSIYFSWGLFLSFPLCFFRLVAFPFTSFK